MTLTNQQIDQAERNGISYSLLRYRVKAGWSIQRAINQPKIQRATDGGMYVGDYHISKAQIDAAAAKGISRQAIRLRIIKHKYTLKDALTKTSRMNQQKRPEIRKYTDEEIALAESNGLTMQTVYSRINRGWGKRPALTTPPQPLKTIAELKESHKSTALKNGISEQLLYYRLRHSWELEEAITLPPSTYNKAERMGERMAYGTPVTAEQIEIAENNGIVWETLKKRIKYGMDVNEAISKPLRKRKRKHTMENDEKDESTVLEVIGRKKYLNRTEYKDHPLPFFPSELKALKQRGLTLDDVDEVKA